MPLYVSDIEADTTHLTIEEDGAYNRLLRLCWRTPKCTIPNDREWIKRRMRADDETYDRAVQPVLDEFFSEKNSRLFQKRQLKEYNKTQASASASRKNGQKGGRPSKPLKNNKTTKPNPYENNNLEKPELELEPYIDKERDIEDISPKKKTKPTPRSVLEKIIDPEIADALLDHRQSMRKPLTRHAATLLLKKLQLCRDGPNAAANMMIENGWQGFDPDWYEKRKEGNSNGKIGKSALAEQLDWSQRWVNGEFEDGKSITEGGTVERGSPCNPRRKIEG